MEPILNDLVVCSKLLSLVGSSNALTKQITATKDARQKIPEKAYTIPDHDTRALMAKLVFEEAMETIDALGFGIEEDVSEGGFRVYSRLMQSNKYEGITLDMEKIIDGACDLTYVAVGVMIGMGVPDQPHLTEVCIANNNKFPGGQVIVDEKTGKYLKPEGWRPPDHGKVQDQVQRYIRQKHDPKSE